jgi:hypothetical protein
MINKTVQMFSKLLSQCINEHHIHAEKRSEIFANIGTKFKNALHGGSLTFHSLQLFQQGT